LGTPSNAGHGELCAHRSGIQLGIFLIAVAFRVEAEFDALRRVFLVSGRCTSTHGSQIWPRFRDDDWRDDILELPLKHVDGRAIPALHESKVVDYVNVTVVRAEMLHKLVWVTVGIEIWHASAVGLANCQAVDAVTIHSGWASADLFMPLRRCPDHNQVVNRCIRATLLQRLRVCSSEACAG
jgi:hypothetical protein